MDRETGKEADTDGGSQTHATRSATSAPDQRRLLAGLQPTPPWAGVEPFAEAQHPVAASADTGLPDAGLPADGTDEASTQPIAGTREAQREEAQPDEAEREYIIGEDRRQAYRAREDDGWEDDGQQDNDQQDNSSQAPARRTPARTGKKTLARLPKQEPARAPGRSLAGRWEQPPRRFVPAFRPIFPGLATDPRLPIWISRALAATAVGVAVTIWQNWRLGLTAAAGVTILDIIYRSRTTSVIPADVRVTSAQRRTRRRLALLRGRGYVALNARAIPGSDSVIDHLVIGPPGVFALDSERWDRRLPVRAAASGRLYHGPFAQEERLEHAVWEAAQASSLLGASLGHQISVRPAMAIYGPTIPWTVASLREVDVLAGRRLRKYFRRQARRAGPRLSADQINRIHAAAAQALPPAR